MEKNESTDPVIRVRFFMPIDGETDYYFGSLAAIYEKFTPEQIGCKLESLWNASIAPDKPKSTRNCVVSRHEIIRKRHNK